MSRYIDADALLKLAVSKFKCVPSVGVIYCGNGEEIFDGEDLQDFIRAMPTADAVEVVRCKNCKHYGGVTYGFVCRKYSGAETKVCTEKDHYCGYGKRRDDGT